MNPTKPPTFSIVLPTHDQSHLLRLALESIRAQTFEDWELFVVGDGCTDDSGEVVQRLAAHDPRIHWRPYEKGYGFGYENRNKALRECRGELIAWLATDDLWMPDHLEKMFPVFNHQEVEWAYSRPVFIERDGAVVPMAFNLFDEEILAGFLGKTNCSIYLCCIVHRRSCLDKYGWWDGTIKSNGDLELWVRFIEGGKRKNFDYYPSPTTLRFRAPYKPDRSGNPWEMQVWQKLVEEGVDESSADPWARSFQLPIPEGIPEQQALWIQIERDPGPWMRRFRREVACQLDHRIWRANHFPYALIPAHRKLSETLGTSLQHNEKLREHVSELQAKIKHLKQRNAERNSLWWSRLKRRLRRE